MLAELIKNLEPYLEQVNQYISEKLNTDIQLLQLVENHILHSNGKRIRPVLHILASLICGPVKQANIIVASTSEFIHTATLLHDDVIDNSATRRGKPTVNNLWGNELSVMVGDFFYTQSMNSLLEIGNLTVVQIFSTATQMMTEGEIIQHENMGNIDIQLDDYLNIIYRKTAVLFSACCESAAVLADFPAERIRNWAQFGKNLGIAFQLIDDLLDYNGVEAVTGKPGFNDLMENKLTMPLIHAIKNGTKQDLKKIQAILQADQKNEEHVKFVADFVEAQGGLTATNALALEYQERAVANLDSFQQTDFYESMISLAEYIVHRVR
ncbi:polyprenyl synthetase family protein [candidate division CSSED10-310 bacterium]|uniref:Polyprenyl synthetase family protein n=1 Tax=candidate division CSSED10-310 bacterium TaxID=2855610 RepID=A0ABV6YSE5_UNCC1